MIETGQTAPDFTLPRDGGGTVTLSAQKPGNVVLYFYPRADTPGCTKEAIAFTEHLDAFAQAGTTVIGVSKDNIKKHDKFRDKYDLTVTLVSDEEGTVCEDWGVWVEKNMYGKTYMGIERATFLIDGTGVVRTIWRNVKVPGHAEAVLEAVKAL